MSLPLILTVLISALGYFVDIYDLLLFGIVRVPSLRDLGVREEQMLTVGLRLLNFQMTGMLIGGVVWGVIGDLRGRKSVLFGSILLYSVANFANAFVHDPETYAWLRFAAGVGLAGELGAAITLVAEVMSVERRGIGTSLVAGVGILGAVAASLVGDHFTWRTAYVIGGALGFALLLMRGGLLESGLFKKAAEADVKRGRFHELFLRPRILGRYVCCILIGVPIWFVIGVLVTFAPEISSAMGVVGVTGSKSIMWCYLGLSVGDIAAGLVSQWWKSRRRAVLAFMTFSLLLLGVYVNAHEWTLEAFYALCVALGFSVGFWAVFVTIGAEQFGTNMRATVATTVPNFVRGSVVPVTLAFHALSASWGVLKALVTVGAVVYGLAYLALFFLRETYGRDLDYFE